MTHIQIDNLYFYDDFQYLHDIFENYNQSIRLVGGVVRDLLMNVSVNDIDYATTATVEEMIEIFKNNNISYYETGISHGTLTARINNSSYEITTLRIDNKCDGRHSKVEFTRNWKEDANRRDFTINAMYVDIYGEIYDYFGGLDDLNNNVVKFVGNPIDRIQEDYLRILRYIRFCVRLNCNIILEGAIHTDILNKANSVLAGERIYSELLKILSEPNILSYKDSYKVYIILSHFIISLNYTFNNLYPPYSQGINLHKRPKLLFALMIKNDNIVSLGDKFKFSNEDEKYYNYIIYHLQKTTTRIFSIQSAYIDIFVNKVNRKAVSDLYFLINKDEITAEFLLTRDFSDFPVNGNDIISMGYEKEMIGKMLKYLKALWIMDDFKLNKEELLEISKEITENAIDYYLETMT